jgi:hypothetical protein
MYMMQVGPEESAQAIERMLRPDLRSTTSALSQTFLLLERNAGAFHLCRGAGGVHACAAVR